MGSKKAPNANCGVDSDAGLGPNVTIKETPVIAEKPYITSEKEKFNLMKPKVDVDRISTTADWDNAEAIPFENVYVASATTDTAASINTKLEEGLHLVL